MSPQSITARQRAIWRERGRFYLAPARPQCPDCDEWHIIQRADPADWYKAPNRVATYLTGAEAGTLLSQLTNDEDFRRAFGLAA